MAWSRAARIAGEVGVIVGVIVVVLLAQDTFTDNILSSGSYRWDHLLQSNVTATPIPAGTSSTTLRYDLPGVTVTATTQNTLRDRIAASFPVPSNNVVINQVIIPIPASLLKTKLSVQQTPGSRVIFTVTGLTAAQAQAAQNTLNANCPANLAPLGVNCATLAASATSVPVAPPASDDDNSGVIGGILGGVGGLCCILAIAAAAFFLLKKKQSKQHHQQHELDYVGPGSVPIGGPQAFPPPPTPLGGPVYAGGPGTFGGPPAFGPGGPGGPYPSF